MKSLGVSSNAYQLFLDIFRQAVGQLLVDSGQISSEAVLQRSRELLSGKGFYIREDNIPDEDLKKFNHIISYFLELLENHMGHYKYGWSSLITNPALFQSFVRDILQ